MVKLSKYLHNVADVENLLSLTNKLHLTTINCAMRHDCLHFAIEHVEHFNIVKNYLKLH